MSWKQRLTDQLADALRMTLKVCAFLNLFALSLLSVWFTCKFVWYFARWLDNTLFAAPWGAP